MLILSISPQRFKGICKLGYNDTAIDFFRLMVEKDCIPNVIAYATVINSLCNKMMYYDAFKLFEEMVYHRGIYPNDDFHHLIVGIPNLDDWDQIKKMLNEMLDERMFVYIMVERHVS